MKHSKHYRLLTAIFSILLVLVGMSSAQDALQDELEAFVASISQSTEAAVSARISIGDETWTSASGLVDVRGTQAAQASDQFRIASMSKPFMAVTLLLLQEDDILSLDDPLSKWLPAALIQPLANAEEVTLEHLVAMTSGIPDYLDDDFMEAVAQDPQRMWTAETALPFAYDEPALFDVGTAFDYSNTNYLLLQLVVERATQQPIHQVMRQRIFEPLGLRDTYTQGAEPDTGRLVRGYEDFDGDGIVEDVSDINDGFGLGDGGLVSTSADLARFYQALWRDGLLLSEASRQAILEADEHDADYGLGFELLEDEDYGLVVGHTGSVLGFSGAVFYALEDDILVCILNASQDGGDDDMSSLFSIASMLDE